MEASKDSNTVLLQETVLIRPTRKQDQPPTVHHLSHLDQLNASIPFYFPILYFFPSGADTPNLMTDLKASLAATLDLYPVVAGRFRRGERGLLEVELNGAGVEFTAAVAEARLDKWADLRFCPLNLQLVANKPFLFGDMMIGAPLMCMQVTTFECGGVALGVSFLHGIGDMQAIAEFVEAWASLHTNPQLALSLSPCLATTALLKPRDPPWVDAPIDALLQLSGAQLGESGLASEDKGATSEGEGSGSGGGGGGGGEAAISTVHAVLRMSDAKVAAALRDVEAGEYSYGRASSFEAVAALLWVAITRARALPPDSVTRFALPVNMRQRWQPPLPQRFFGNAALPAVSIARTQDLLERHFSYAAKLVHESISAVHVAYGQAAIDWLELQLREHGHVGLHDLLRNGQDLHASVMVGFALYELNFGWGHTSQISLPLAAQTNGALIVMMSPRGGRARDLAMWLKIEHMRKLLVDPLFAPYLEGEEQLVEELSSHMQ